MYPQNFSMQKFKNLKANNYKLEYEYEDGINRFICKKDEQSTI